MVKALRPKQWVKNLLVVAAPLAAAKLFHSGVPKNLLLAFLGFAFIASAGYIINDLRDIERDKINPTKSHRPIASGKISKTQAYLLIALCLVAGTGFAISLSPAFQVTLLCYFIFTTSYSFGLKHQPVIELLIVALGFVLRAIGGAAATDTPISKWFLVVTAFGSLVVVTSKRLAEAESLANVDVRPVIREYPLPFLRFVLSTSAGVTLTGYSLWALSLNQSTPYATISLLPLCLGLFRYVWMVEKGSGEVPEDLLLRDPVLISSALSIALLLALSIY